MVKNIKLLALVLACAGAFSIHSATTALTDDLGTDLWGNTVFDAFQNLVAKHLLTFGKSDRITTSKDELLNRTGALKDSLGEFSETVKNSKDKHANTLDTKLTTSVSADSFKDKVDTKDKVDALPLPPMQGPAALPSTPPAPVIPPVSVIAPVPVLPPAPVLPPVVTPPAPSLPVLPVVPVLPVESASAPVLPPKI